MTRRSRRRLARDLTDLACLTALGLISWLGRRPSKAKRERLNRLRAVAEAADHGGRPWGWMKVRSDGYPQRIVRSGDAALIAECFEDPGHEPTMAEFISTFDPPTVLSLLASDRTIVSNVLPRRGRTGRAHR